jgi:polyisoprenyl-phosphate glycosyltransferase
MTYSANNPDESVYISVVVPAYGAPESLQELCDRLVGTLSSFDRDFEIILVNDASPDDSWERIKALARTDNRVRGINLSRNFGQHYAITAGLDHARGEWVVVMDCDLQDQPEEITKLHARAMAGLDIVVGRRADRKDGYFKRLASRLFYRFYEYFTEVKVTHSIASFGIYSKRAIESIRRLREQNRSFGLFAIWVGFSRDEIDVVHAPRERGRSAYTLKKMVGLAMDSIVAHSNKPLKLCVALGFLISASAIIYALWLVVMYFLYTMPSPGWTSLIVSMYFLSGLTIGAIGVLGIYVGKIFDEVKGRPLYIIGSTTFER